MTADYAFGTNLEKDTTDVIKAEGGKVIGSVRHPLNASDFSSFLLQAQSSKAKITHYLKAVAGAGTDETTAVMARMKATPVNDFMTKNGQIREDGRLIRDMYVFEVKKPGESAYPWDY